MNHPCLQLRDLSAEDVLDLFRHGPTNVKTVAEIKLHSLDEPFGFKPPVAEGEVLERHAGVDFSRVLRDDQPLVQTYRDEVHGDARNLHTAFVCLPAGPRIRETRE
jgi:hypothetical protein